MIAARMDPKQRAGQTAKSNVKNAQNFGRGHMLGLAMLLKAFLEGPKTFIPSDRKTSDIPAAR